MTEKPRRRRTALRAALASAALVVAPLAVAGPAQASEAAATRPPAAQAQVPVAYDCFVTFPGGATTVQYALTFGVTAPAQARRFVPYTVTLDTPPITPNPTLQSDVRDVQVAFEVPANTIVLSTRLSGGSGLGSSTQVVSRDGRVLTLTGSGPFPAATVFDLPALTVTLLPLATGPAQVTTGGTSVDDPSFFWMRNSLSPGDPPGTLRSFNCQPPVDVVLGTTDVRPIV